MRQPVSRGYIRSFVLITTCLLCVAVGAADYYAPPDYATPSGTTIIHAGTLLAVPGESPANDQSIIVQNGQIVEIRAGRTDGANFEADGEVRVIDLSDQFVMPGFIDLHVHLTGQAGSGGRNTRSESGPGG